MVGDTFCVEAVCYTDGSAIAVMRGVLECHTVFDLILEKKELMMAAQICSCPTYGGAVGISQTDMRDTINKCDLAAE